MAGISLSGLSTGIDTTSIITQLMAIESQPRQALVIKQDQATARQNALKDVMSKLQTLASAAADLRDPTLWSNVQTASSSDATKVSVVSSSGAAAGGYTVNVTSLAVAEQHVYNYTARPNPSSITIGGTTVNLAQNATVQDAMNAVNATAGLGVTASVNNNQLVLTSKTTGAASGFSASGQTIVEDTTQQQFGADAQFTVNGVAKTSASNTNVTNAILGVTLNLQTTTPGTPVTITVNTSALNQQAVKDKIKAFVDTYNSTVDFIRGKLDEKRDPKATTEPDALKGVLFSDPTLTDVLDRMRIAIYSPVAGNPSTMDTMGEIGISTGASTGAGTINQDSVDGKLVIDDAALTTALTNNPAGVQQLLGATTGIDGFAQSFEGIVNSYSQTGGILDTRVTSAGDDVKDIGDQITAMDQRLSMKEALLKSQFAAMESIISSQQSMGSALSGQLAGLSGGSG